MRWTRSRDPSLSVAIYGSLQLCTVQLIFFPTSMGEDRRASMMASLQGWSMACADEDICRNLAEDLMELEMRGSQASLFPASTGLDGGSDGLTFPSPAASTVLDASSANSIHSSPGSPASPTILAMYRATPISPTSLAESRVTPRGCAMLPFGRQHRPHKLTPIGRAMRPFGVVP